MGNLVLQATPALPEWQGEVLAQSYRQGLRTAPVRGRVRLERRAVKVACVVLRGLGGCEPTWLPGGYGISGMGGSADPWAKGGDERSKANCWTFGYRV